jgi:hypothetical protein
MEWDVNRGTSAKSLVGRSAVSIAEDISLVDISATEIDDIKKTIFDTKSEVIL